MSQPLTIASNNNNNGRVNKYDLRIGEMKWDAMNSLHRFSVASFLKEKLLAYDDFCIYNFFRQRLIDSLINNLSVPANGADS